MQKSHKTSNYTHRKLEDLNLIDDFLFQEIMSDEEYGEKFCRILLSTILNRPIRHVRITPQKNILGIDTNCHGIRMDAYIEELPETPLCDAEISSDVYDIEPDNGSDRYSLPKRMRYYHGMIDTQLLAIGNDYSLLPNVVIILILPYDPFSKNRMIYTVQNTCLEDSSIPYEDGAKKIFLYTKGTEGNPSQALRDMLKYIEHSRQENIFNSDIASIHEMVADIKKRKEVGIYYMKSWEREKLFREMGKEEGKSEIIISLTQKKFHKGYSIQDIADALEEPLDTITPIVKLIEQYPDASTEEIFEMLKEEDSMMLL